MSVVYRSILDYQENNYDSNVIIPYQTQIVLIYEHKLELSHKVKKAKLKLSLVFHINKLSLALLRANRLVIITSLNPFQAQF